MALTKVRSGVRTLGTGEVATANMAVDPTNASNLSSGSVPLAQLGNAPSTDTTTIEDDIALLGFKVAANGSFGKYNLVDQTEDAFMDATGIDTSASTNETRNAANYYSGNTTTTPTASGGTVTTVGDYTIHSFLSGTSSYINDTAQDIDVLVVAGGGGAGAGQGGGGGGGGMRTFSAIAAPSGTHSVTVGAAGGKGTNATPSTDGGDSVLAVTGGSTYTSNGGGFGGSYNTYAGPNSGNSGGSGGGGGSGHVSPGAGGAGNTPSTSPSQGASGAGVTYSEMGGGGGGGGASGVAGATNPAHGGDGTQNDFRTGSDVYYSGGGSGRGASARSGGAGGGGGTTQNGTTNSGGGGGGGTHDHDAGAGGSGIVVLKRITTFGSVQNLTLVSNATTAEATATKGDIVMTYTNAAGTATLNTDLTAEFSANNGTDWTSMTLVVQGNTGSASPHFIVAAHNVTAGTSGTAMRYRIKTLNQTVSKETRIQAVSLGWS